MTPQTSERAETRAAPLDDSAVTRQVGARSTRRLVPLILVGLTLAVAACGGGSPAPSSQATTLISQGLTAESQGQIGPAINDFNAAAAKNPTNAIPYYDLGVAYQLRLNEPAKAVTEYNKAILADSTYKPALYNLAILETKGDPQDAINLYGQLLKLNPNDPTVNFNLGLLLLSQNLTTQGHADIQKAIFLKPALKSRLPAGVSP
jgi:tetratricopeptide (TPR) repeat protein